MKNFLIKFLINKNYRFIVLANLGLKKHLPDDIFLQKLYKIHTGATLNLDTPILYTEKLQWLKLYDHRPEYTTMVDKYLAKKYVANIIGKEYIVPTYGVWERADEIDYDKLPEKFVLKATHDSGSVIVCTDKSSLDIIDVKKKLNRALKKNYYHKNKEWPYKNVVPRIIAEKYIVDSKYNELRDYKFFTFGGEPKIVYIAQGRGSQLNTFADFFDMDFNHLPFTIDHEMALVPPEKPNNFELMKELAKKISQGTPQLRVDFYEVDGHVYFGEMTFFHCSGMELFHPAEWNKIFGDWVQLPSKTLEE